MINVETTNPVYSSADGKINRKRKTPVGNGLNLKVASPDGKGGFRDATKRETRKFNRKAKRNAPKLKRVKRKNGATALVMKLIKLMPKQKKQKFSGVDAVLTAVVPVSTEYTKTFEDGTTITIPATDVIVNTAGVFDKSDIARAFGVTKETLTPEMIDKYLVYLVPTPTNATTTTETDKSATADVSIVIDPNKVVETPEGTFLATDTQDETETEKDVAVEQKKEQAPLKKYEKIILWGGIGLVVLIAGVIIYRKMSKGGSKGK